MYYKPAIPVLKQADLKTLPKVLSEHLSNNIPVNLIKSGTEDIVRIEFYFRAGNLAEDIPLIASTTNMMLSEGTENYTSTQLNRKLDFYGVFYNLFVEKDLAGIVLYCMNKYLEKTLELAYELLFRPTFPLSELKSLMKKRLNWFLINRDKVQNLAIDQFFQSVFGKDHPYGRQIVSDDFRTLTPETLKNFHSRYYSVDNMAVIVSGRMNDNTLHHLDKYFGRIRPSKTRPAVTSSFIRGDEKKCVHVNKEGTVQTAIRIGSSTINKRHPDYTGLKILDMIIGGYFGSRLMKNLREEKGYTYGIRSLVTSLDLTGYKIISTEVGNKNIRKAIDEIYKELTHLQEYSVGREELTIVRNYMMGEILRMFDGPFATAETYRSIWQFGLDESYFHRLADKIKTITPDEITDLAKTYYIIEDLYEITAGAG